MSLSTPDEDPQEQPDEQPEPFTDLPHPLDFTSLAARVQQSMTSASPLELVRSMAQQAQPPKSPTDLLNGMARQAVNTGNLPFDWSRPLASQLAPRVGQQPDFGRTVLALTDFSNPTKMARYWADELARQGPNNTLAGLGPRSVTDMVRQAQQPSWADPSAPLYQGIAAAQRRKDHELSNMLSLAGLGRSWSAYERAEREAGVLGRSLAWLTRTVAQSATFERLVVGAQPHFPRAALPVASLTLTSPEAFLSLAAQARALAGQLQAAPAELEQERAEQARAIERVEHVATVVSDFAQRLNTRSLASTADVQRLRSDVFGVERTLRQQMQELAPARADQPGGWRYNLVAVVPLLLALLSLPGLVAQYAAWLKPAPAQPTMQQLLHELRALHHEVSEQAADSALRAGQGVVAYAAEAPVLAAPRPGARLVGRVERGQLLLILFRQGPYLLVQYLDESGVREGYVRKRAIRKVRPR